MCQNCREALEVKETLADQIIDALIDDFSGLTSDHSTDEYESWRRKIFEIITPKPMYASANEYLKACANEIREEEGWEDDEEDFELPKTREELIKGVSSRNVIDIDDEDIK